MMEKHLGLEAATQIRIASLCGLCIALFSFAFEPLLSEPVKRILSLLLSISISVPLIALRTKLVKWNGLTGNHWWKLGILVPITLLPFLLQANQNVDSFSIHGTIRDCFQMKTGGYWIEFYLSLELAFRLAIATEDSRQRKDEWAVKIHHILTIVLLSSGIFFEFHGVSMLILVVHNAADIFLDVSQIIRLEKMSHSLLIVSFVSLLISWILTRLIFYPIIIHYTFTKAPGYFYETTFDRSPIEYQSLSWALLGLQCLHIFWTQSLFRVTWSFYTKSRLLDLTKEN